MNIKKRYIKVIIIMIALSVLFFIFVGIKLIKNEKEYVLIALDNNVVFKKENNKWTTINQENELKKYNWHMLYTFTDNTYLGKFNIYYNDELYLFDKNRKAVNYNGDFIAINNQDVKLVNFETIDIKNDSHVEKVLNDNNIKNKELTSAYFIELDTDNDNKKERIYVISNRFSYNNSKLIDYFSFVFIVDNEKISIIYKNIEHSDDSYSGCKPYIKSILDINNDNKYEIIINCAQYSMGKTNSMIYQYNKKKYKMVAAG